MFALAGSRVAVECLVDVSHRGKHIAGSGGDSACGGWEHNADTLLHCSLHRIHCVRSFSVRRASCRGRRISLSAARPTTLASEVARTSRILPWLQQQARKRGCATIWSGQVRPSSFLQRRMISTRQGARSVVDLVIDLAAEQDELQKNSLRKRL